MCQADAEGKDLVNLSDHEQLYLVELDGARAAIRHQPVTANPYPFGSASYSCWFFGYERHAGRLARKVLKL